MENCCRCSSPSTRPAIGGQPEKGGILPETEALHKKYANEPHYYLDNLGVLPSAQGRGYSSKLIRPFLARADAERVIAYTDTVTRSNVAIYQHFGFECVEEGPIAGTDLTVLRCAGHYIPDFEVRRQPGEIGEACCPSRTKYGDHWGNILGHFGVSSSL